MAKQSSDMTVRVLVGASAYAVVNTPQVHTDILLAPGKSASASLRETAADWRAKAHRYASMAKIAAQAADVLES